MTTIDELSRTVKDQADLLDALAKRLGSLGRAEIERSYVELEARLADAIPLRTGSYPAGAEVFAAGSTEPGQTNLLADGSVTLPAFGPTTRPVVIATVLPSLPNALYPVGSTVVVEGTGVMYRNVANVWVAAVGAIAGGIAALGALPSLPDSAYPTGCVVYLTTDGKLYRNVAGTWSKAVDGGDITASSILADSIGAGQVTAAKLAATILLASVIKTAETGNIHVEISSGGIVLLDASNVPLVILPTNGDPVYVKGAVVASSLISTSTAELRGATLLPADSVLTLASGIRKPSTAPVLTQSVAGTFDLAAVPTDWADKGLAWDPASSTWYAAFWGPTGANPAIREFNGTTGALIREVALGFDGSNVVNGIGVSSTHVYLSVRLSNATARLYKYLRTDLSEVTSVPITAHVTELYNSAMFYDATADRIVVITTTGTGAGKQVRFRLYDQALTLQSTIDDTSGGFTFNGDTTVMQGGVRAEGYYWVALVKDAVGTPGIRCFNLSTGAYVANQDFGYVAPTWYAVCGIGHNGTAFYGRGTAVAESAADPERINQFSNWNWTTESAVYWVGYSWYDPDGTTHETEAGPRASITMGRRLRLQVVSAAIPGAGGADDPDNARIYMARNATEPAAGSYKLQATDALTSRYLTDFATGGAADPTTNDFPGGTPAKLVLTDLTASTEGALGWDSVRRSLLAGDSSRAKPVTPVGWAIVAYPAGQGLHVGMTAQTTTLATSGGSVSTAIYVPAPMLLQSFSYRNMDASGAHTLEWRLYLDRLNASGTVDEIAGANGTFSFTPAGQDTRHSPAAGAPVLLAPGYYWVVLRNTHASSTAGVRVTHSTDSFVGETNVGFSKAGVGALGATIDLVTGWGATGLPAMALNGRVLGQSGLR